MQYITWRNVGLAIVFLWFMGGGITHFTDPDFFVAIVPPYVPYPLEVVYISGVFEIAGAIGILIPRLRAAAGLGLFVLTLCVTPANLHAWKTRSPAAASPEQPDGCSSWSGSGHCCGG